MSQSPPKPDAVDTSSLPYKDNYDEFFYLEESNKKPVIVKCIREKPSPKSNSTVIYIREQSLSPTPQEPSKLNVTNKPGKTSLSTSKKVDEKHKVKEPSVEVIKKPPRCKGHSEKASRREKNCGDFVPQKLTPTKCNLRSNYTLRRSDLIDRLKASVIANYCYIPPVEEIYNKLCSNHGNGGSSTSEEK